MKKHLLTCLYSGLSLGLLFFILACWILTLIHPGYLNSFPLFLLLVGVGSTFGFVLGMGGLLWLFDFFGRQSSKFHFILQRLTSGKMLILVLLVSILSLAALRLLAWQLEPRWKPEKRPNLLILGLDGATWDIMEPMMDEGKLPHLKRLREQGAYGVLQSLEPMDSPVLWASIATGRPPGEHGVTGFFSNRDEFTAVRFWDLCKSHHIRVGLCSWLLTWPLRDPFSFVIPSWIAQTPETYPSEYSCFQESYLEMGQDGGKLPVGETLWRCFTQGARLQALQKQGWFYGRDWLGMTEEERLAAKSMADVPLRTDLFLTLLDRYQPQAAAFILYGTDKLGHRFWHYLEPASFDHVDPEKIDQFQEVIPRYYEAADRAFGQILAACPEDTTVMVLSDHGMKADTAFPRQFFFNLDAWMELAEGYGKVQPSFINRRLILKPRIEDTGELNRIVEFFEAVKFEENDEPVFSVTQDEEGDYVVRTTFSLTWHPESPLNENEHLILQGSTYRISELFFSRGFSGNHDPEGIFILSGPQIRDKIELEEIDLLDIAPTVMALLDLPISRELPGRIMTEAFDTPLSPQYVDEYPPMPQWEEMDLERSESYMERLRSVGYIE